MKRCRFGAGLLILLLVLGLVTGKWMERRHLALADLARESLEAAREGDAERCRQGLEALEDQWNRQRKAASVLADHALLDEIGQLIRQLREVEDRDFRVENGLRLEAMLRDLARNQKLNLANLF